MPHTLCIATEASGSQPVLVLCSVIDCKVDLSHWLVTKVSRRYQVSIYGIYGVLGVLRHPFAGGLQALCPTGPPCGLGANRQLAATCVLPLGHAQYVLRCAHQGRHLRSCEYLLLKVLTPAPAPAHPLLTWIPHCLRVGRIRMFNSVYRCRASRGARDLVQQLQRCADCGAAADAHALTSSQQAACAALHNVAREGRVPAAAIAAAPGAFEALTALLSKASPLPLRVAAARAVRALTETCAPPPTALPGCITSLTALLSASTPSELQLHAAWALHNIAAASTASRDAVAALPDCLPTLAALLQAPAAPPPVHEAAAVTLCRLAEGSAAHSAAISAHPGCLAALVALLGAGSPPGAQKAAARALAALAGQGADSGQQLHSSCRQAVADTPGCIAALAALLAPHTPPTVQEAAAQALAVLAAGSAEAGAEVAAAAPGCTAALVTVLHLRSSPPAVQEAAANALAALGAPAGPYQCGRGGGEGQAAGGAVCGMAEHCAIPLMALLLLARLRLPMAQRKQEPCSDPKQAAPLTMAQSKQEPCVHGGPDQGWSLPAKAAAA